MLNDRRSSRDCHVSVTVLLSSLRSRELLLMVLELPVSVVSTSCQVSSVTNLCLRPNGSARTSNGLDSADSHSHVRTSGGPGH